MQFLRDRETRQAADQSPSDQQRFQLTSGNTFSPRGEKVAGVLLFCPCKSLAMTESSGVGHDGWEQIWSVTGGA